jgi:hypothetical protein
MIFVTVHGILFTARKNNIITIWPYHFVVECIAYLVLHSVCGLVIHRLPVIIGR